jgi:hypothetical protein
MFLPLLSPPLRETRAYASPARTGTEGTGVGLGEDKGEGFFLQRLTHSKDGISFSTSRLSPLLIEEERRPFQHIRVPQESSLFVQVETVTNGPGFLENPYAKSKRYRATLAAAVQKRAIVWSAPAKRRAAAAALSCRDTSGTATPVSLRSKASLNAYQISRVSGRRHLQRRGVLEL